MKISGLEYLDFAITLCRRDHSRQGSLRLVDPYSVVAN